MNIPDYDEQYDELDVNLFGIEDPILLQDEEDSADFAEIELDAEDLEDLLDVPEPVAVVEEPTTEAIPERKRKKNYLNNADILIQFKLSMKKGQMTDIFCHMMITLTDRYASKPRFAGYSYIDDMKSYAIMMIVRTWHKFNPEKSDNPFAFFTQCIKHSFFQYLNKEFRQRLIRDELLLDAGLNPSNTYTSNYEHQLSSERNSDDATFQFASSSSPTFDGDTPINVFD